MGKTTVLLAKQKGRKTMAEVKKAMSVKEAREAIGKPKVVTLPSGLSIKVKRLTPYDFIQEGLTSIPNEFYAFIVDLHQGRLDLSKEDENKAKANIDIFEKFIDITLSKGCIEPQVIFKYDKEKAESHLFYMELDNADQAMLISEIIGKHEAK